MKRLPAVALALTLAAIAPAWGRSPGQQALDDGVAQYKQGLFADALSSFRRAVDLDPSLTKAWENIGWAQHRLGDDREALRVWRTVLKLEPRNVACWNAVGEVQLADGAWSDAAAAFARSLAVEPDQTDVNLRLGETYEKLGRPDDAASQYHAILRRRPSDAKATVRLADLEEARGRLDAAEAVLRAGLARGYDPEHLVPARLARVLAKKGDDAYHAERWADAVVSYREALSFDAGRTTYLVNLGWAQRRAGDNAAAVISWNQALLRGVANPADLWRAVGDAELDRGRRAEAREAYTRATAADRRAIPAYYALASAALDDGDTSGAARAIRDMMTTGGAGEEDAARAADLFIHHDAMASGQALFESLASDPAHGAAANVALARLCAARGGAAFRAGNAAEAVVFYRRALKADPRNRAALRDAGWASWGVGDWDGARLVWERYRTAYPELAEPHELSGRLELLHGSPGKAIDHARAALAINEAALSPNILLTKAYLADGKFRHARELAKSLAAGFPDDLTVQTLYGEALWRSLDFPSAAVQWRKVIDMGGETPRAMHCWLRSLYETGAYVQAIAEAEAAVASGAATEPVVRLLAEDALVRGDDAATVHWYRELTERFPQRIGYWTALAETYRKMEKFGAEVDVLEMAFVRHPSSPEIRLLLAGAELLRGHPSDALTAYRALSDRLGRNRTVFEGELHSLRGVGRLDEALALVRAHGSEHFDPNERALEEASILEDMGRRLEAASTRRRVITPPAGTVELPVLLYHGIGEHPRSMSLPLGQFAGQMEAIHDAGYTTITVLELDAMLAGRVPFPERPILITFDDARSDSIRYADPLLARLGMKATMFVPTVRIADESAFSTDWATLRRLAVTGRWDFQAHGHLAHDPIPVDARGALAEFLVNRQWLDEESRMETRDEFVARVEGDYKTCLRLLTDNIPGQAVIGYAFPFSEMGQLHGGNEPEALAVNERAFGRTYRYGFVQDTSGFNTVVPGGRRPLLLKRLNVERNWNADRLLAQLSSSSPAERARLDGVRADVANAELRKAEADLRRMIEEEPRRYPEAGVVLAFDLEEQEREREGHRAYDALPSGPEWGRPDAARRKLANNLGWSTDPQAGAELRFVADSDHRDTMENLATGAYSFGAPVDLRGSLGSARFRDDDFPTLSGIQATLGANWAGWRHLKLGGWLRGRSFDGGSVRTLEGQVAARSVIDGHRFGGACGVTDVETVGALRNGIMRHGCEGSYDIYGRAWKARVRLAYGDLTDGNAIGYAWADGTVDVSKRFRIAAGGRLEVGDSRQASSLYYAPTGLVTALGLVRYARSFPHGASIEAEAGLGPSRDSQAEARIVGRARVAWTQDWGAQWRSSLSADYGATPNYRRTAISLSFGYRF